VVVFPSFLKCSRTEQGSVRFPTPHPGPLPEGEGTMSPFDSQRRSKGSGTLELPFGKTPP